jgi:hypothetical protein
MNPYHGMKPYRFTFNANGKRHSWIRFYRDDMELALADSKEVALREYPLAHAFMIESDQNDESIRKSWGLPA